VLGWGVGWGVGGGVWGVFWGFLFGGLFGVVLVFVFFWGLLKKRLGGKNETTVKTVLRGRRNWQGEMFLTRGAGRGHSWVLIRGGITRVCEP